MAEQRATEQRRGAVGRRRRAELEPKHALTAHLCRRRIRTPSTTDVDSRIVGVETEWLRLVDNKTS
jgi:hypothetical protein